jgi:hypothetical protein
MERNMSYMSMTIESPSDDDLFDFKLTTEPTTAADVSVYNGFEVVFTTKIDSANNDIGGLVVDPTNPNTDVDGRDFLVWQRGNVTPGPDDNVQWPIGPIPELNTETLTIVHEGFWLI